jgi:hypothetical protein
MAGPLGTPLDTTDCQEVSLVVMKKQGALENGVIAHDARLLSGTNSRCVGGPLGTPLDNKDSQQVPLVVMNNKVLLDWHSRPRHHITKHDQKPLRVAGPLRTPLPPSI